MTDEVTRAYIEECLSPRSRLRDIAAAARFPQRYVECFGGRILARPFFIPEAETRRAADDLIGLFDLLVDLPRRLFDGDLRRYCAALGFGARQTALMLRCGTGRPALFGRSDLYHDGVSLKLLEFNVGSQLGGIDQAQVLPAYLRIEAFRAFAERHRLGYVHTGAEIARALRAVAEPVAHGDVPVVALVEADGALEPLGPLLRSFQEMLVGHGLDLRLAEVGDLRYDRGKLRLADGTPVDAVLRYFSVNQICRHPRGEEAVAPIFRAHDEGGTPMLTTMDSFLFANKGCLALLSDPRWGAAFSPAERELIDRVIPWTRVLVSGPTSAGGRDVDLIEYCRENRDRLILKPRDDFGGNGIVTGWTHDAGDWKEALSRGEERGYVVQERVPQRREPLVDPATGRLEQWVAAWSTFVTPSGYAGAHIRALPADQQGIIGRGANAATRVTGVYSFPSPAPAPPLPPPVATPTPAPPPAAG